MNNFKEDYEKSNTYGDLDRAVTNNIKSYSDACLLRDSMQLVKDTTGLDMRQDYMLNLLKTMINNNIFK